jgi:glycosyltransferase involved in cell wall biosynthesis
MNQCQKISVITATFNAVEQLPSLISSLKMQVDKNFEWIVVDGASTDGTIALLEGVEDIDVRVSSSPDFGIYDALNKGVALASGDYYLVLGADDALYPGAIGEFRRAASASNADIVTAEVMIAGERLKVREGKVWRYGLNGLISAHSVGSLFRRSLHERFGLYSKRFPIAADQYFVMRACAGGATRCVSAALVGEFGVSGVSNLDIAGVVTESFRVQLALGRNKLVQTMLLILRVIRNYSRL